MSSSWSSPWSTAPSRVETSESSACLSYFADSHPPWRRVMWSLSSPHQSWVWSTICATFVPNFGVSLNVLPNFERTAVEKTTSLQQDLYKKCNQNSRTLYVVPSRWSAVGLQRLMMSSCKTSFFLKISQGALDVCYGNRNKIHKVSNGGEKGRAGLPLSLDQDPIHPPSALHSG